MIARKAFQIMKKFKVSFTPRSITEKRSYGAIVSKVHFKALQCRKQRRCFWHLELLHLAPGGPSICANVPRPFMGHTFCLADVWRLGKLGSKSWNFKIEDAIMKAIKMVKICQCLPIFMMFHFWLHRLFVTVFFWIYSFLVSIHSDSRCPLCIHLSLHGSCLHGENDDRLEGRSRWVSVHGFLKGKTLEFRCWC